MGLKNKEIIIEGRIPAGWKEETLKEGNHYLHFGLVGALITKSRIENGGEKAIVVKIGEHYEVHKLVTEALGGK